MSGLGEAAAVSELIGVTFKLVELARQWKHANEDIDVFLGELKALVDILQNLDLAMKSRADIPSSSRDSTVLLRNSELLTTKFNALIRKLEKVSQGRTERLKYLFKQGEYSETLNQIRAFSRLIEFALSVDTWRLLSSKSMDTAKLLQQQVESLDTLDKIGNRIVKLQDAIEDQISIVQNMRLDSERQNVLNWLADEAQDAHDRIRQDRVEGTGEWLLHHPEFVRWKGHEPNSNMLWCPGEMGSGKSNLSSLVIDHLRMEYNPSLAYFYFSYADSASQTMRQVLGSLIGHLVQNADRSDSPTLTRLIKKYKSVKVVPLQDLSTVLIELFNSIQRTYLVFDAIDEANETETLKPFLQLLKTLFDLPQVRIYATGRPILATFDEQPTIPIIAHDDDLRIFIQDRIEAANSPELSLDQAFQAEISDTLISSAGGTFLLPSLQLNQILQEPTQGDMEDALQNLPSKLAGVVDRNIGRITSQQGGQRSIGMNTLMWVCCARKPLKWQEMSDILSLDLSQKRPLNRKFMPSRKKIMECCRGLVSFDDSTQTLHFVHSAIQNHIQSQEARLFEEPMKRIAARACFLYLLDPVFECGPVGSEEDDELTVEGEIRKFRKDHEFFNYLARNWGWHARQRIKNREIRGLIIEFLDSPSRIALSTQISRYLGDYKFEYWCISHVWSVRSLQIASEFGLMDIACEMLDTRKVKDIDYMSQYGGSALIMAAASNKVEMVKALLDRGANPYKANWYGNALHCAAERNSVKTLKELLAFGVDPNCLSPGNDPRTPLGCTTDRDSVEAAEMLLNHGASLYYDTAEETWEKSIFGEIYRMGAVDVILMIIRRGFFRSKDRANAIKTIDKMSLKEFDKALTEELMQHLQSQSVYSTEAGV